MFPIPSKFAYTLVGILTQEASWSSICVSQQLLHTHYSAFTQLQSPCFSPKPTSVTSVEQVIRLLNLKKYEPQAPFHRVCPQNYAWVRNLHSYLYGHRGSFVFSELNKTCSWSNMLNIPFKTSVNKAKNKVSNRTVRKDTQKQRADFREEPAIRWKFYLGGRATKNVFFMGNDWRMLGRSEEEPFLHVGLTQTLQKQLTVAGELLCRATICLSSPQSQFVPVSLV